MIMRCGGIARLSLCVFAGLLAVMPAHAVDSVATAVRVIYPGQTIEADMVKLVSLKREMPNAARSIQSLDALIGKVATKTILPNRLILPSAVIEGNIVEAGQNVRVLYETEAISISLVAVALEDGVVGDTIRVRNQDSARIIAGRISDDGTIYVSAL
jgi:flagellar basal body P-ring formation protein FlgA